MTTVATVPPWQALEPADAAAVRALADVVHPGLPERTEVFAERIHLFPDGCCKLMGQGTLLGYGIAHPWHLDAPPALDTLLGALPGDADCLHLHDLVMDPRMRGRGAPALYLARMETVARAHGLPALAMVSVYGTNRLWSRFGFVERDAPGLAVKLAAYGATARYLVRRL